MATDVRVYVMWDEDDETLRFEVDTKGDDGKFDTIAVLSVDEVKESTHNVEYVSTSFSESLPEPVRHRPTSKAGFARAHRITEMELRFLRVVEETDNLEELVLAFANLTARFASGLNYVKG